MPLSMGLSRQEYWSGLPFRPPGDLPNSGIKPKSPASPALQTNSLPLSHRENPPMSCLNLFIFGFLNLLYTTRGAKKPPTMMMHLKCFSLLFFPKSFKFWNFIFSKIFLNFELMPLDTHKLRTVLSSWYNVSLISTLFIYNSGFI